jgi:hypothetical protein
MCVFVNPLFKLTFECNFISKCEFGYQERSRSTDEDLDIALCGYSVYHEINSDEKNNVIMAFKINALLHSSDLKTLIGVDLSAWTTAFAPSLLSDPPRVSIPFGPPH